MAAAVAEVHIRPGTVADGPAVAGIYASYVDGPGVSFELAAPGPVIMARRIADTLPTHPWLIAERDGRAVAYAYAGVYGVRPAYRWTTEAAIYVGQSERGRGVGRILYPVLLAVLRAQGFRSALARIALPNPGSTRLHSHCGFRQIGTHPDAGYKHGVWYPIDYWACTLNAVDPPTEPIYFSALPDLAGLLTTA